MDCLFYYTRISKKELHKKDMFKELEFSMKELQEFLQDFSLTKSSFYIMVFNEKIVKIKAFDAYPTLETCSVFLDNR